MLAWRCDAGGWRRPLRARVVMIVRTHGEGRLRCIGMAVVILWGTAARAQEESPANDSADGPAAGAPARPPDEGKGRTASPSKAQVEALGRRLEELEAEVAELRAQREKAAADAAADPAGAGGDEEQAELAALMSDVGADELAPVSEIEPLRIYGFADMGLHRAWGGLFDLGLGATDETTFVFGSANIFFDFQPEPDWRFLTEVRFTLFPTGAPSFDPVSGDVSEANTSVVDASSPNSGFEIVNWSGIILERSHIDYSPSTEFNVRAGLFLTPYGIWNVDHGSPVRIMIWPPITVSANLINERQTGVELFGRVHFLPWHVGYHLYVSNGQPTSQVDFDDDKAIGGRVYVGRGVPDAVQIGASFFHGSQEQVSQGAGIRPDGSFGLVREITSQSTNTAVGVDFSLDHGGFRLRTEAIARWQVFETGRRPVAFGATTADNVSVGGYVLGAYRFHEPDIEPFAVMEFIRLPLRILEAAALPGVGLNLHFSPAASLRFQYTYIQAIDLQDYPGPGVDGLDLHSIASRLVLAF
jgi:hypothetical protein